MTKPIEGWVVQRNSDLSLIGFFESLEEAQRNYGNTTEIWTFRPVKITFTDEPSTEVADAIRKERERIWKIITDELPVSTWREVSATEIKIKIFEGVS